jgi:hypothetical protein
VASHAFFIRELTAPIEPAAGIRTHPIILNLLIPHWFDSMTHDYVKSFCIAA